MKSEKNMFVAFALNLAFSIFEFFGGVFTGSVAIVSDALHDTGDALSIGVAFFLEKKSKKQPDEKYTYGYARYSVLGGVLTTLILLLGSSFVVYNAFLRLINPIEINYNGMIIFAVVGVCVNLLAAVLTGKGESLNQRAVNLHMIEDVLGWIVVLVGATIMRFTDFYILDPLMSIGVAVFIFINALRELKAAIDLFLEKAPRGISVDELYEHIKDIDGVLGVHHIHVWSMDGRNNYATVHIVVSGDACRIKQKVREELRAHSIGHVTIEIEAEGEACPEEVCRVELSESGECHHLHHHHH